MIIEQASELAGKSALIIEDEPLLVFFLEEVFAEIGLRLAGIATTLADAMDFCERGDFDVAILDANLHGQQTSPVAALLASKKKPFILASGYGDPGFDIGNSPVVPKPYDVERLHKALREVLCSPL